MSRARGGTMGTDVAGSVVETGDSAVGRGWDIVGEDRLQAEVNRRIDKTGSRNLADFIVFPFCG